MADEESQGSSSTVVDEAVDGVGDRVILEGEAAERAKSDGIATKRVLIIGASSGMGAGLAIRFGKSGARVSVAARRLERLKEVAAQCEEAGAPATLCIKTDVSQRSQCHQLFQTLAKAWGGVDIVVYCVGQAMHTLMADITHLQAVMDRMMNTNFFGAIYCTHYAFPYLQASKGSLAVVSSVAGGISPPYLTFYAAAKHAVHGFFNALRNEEPGFYVTILCPGYVATEIDDKKMVGDGTVKPVALNVDKSKYMSVEKASKLMVDAIKKHKKEFHLTTSGSVGVTFRSLFPGTVDSAVRKEMKVITDEDKIRKRQQKEASKSHQDSN